MNAQLQFPSLSPRAHLSQYLGFTSINIDYERPAVRKREIFGKLVPWNAVWLTGAGHCTVIRFSKPVIINNNKLAAGAYSLLSILRQNSWTIIFNKDTSSKK